MEAEGTVLRRKLFVCASAGRREAPSTSRAKTRLSHADTFTAGTTSHRLDGPLITANVLLSWSILGNRALFQRCLSVALPTK